MYQGLHIPLNVMIFCNNKKVLKCQQYVCKIPLIFVCMGTLLIFVCMGTLLMGYGLMVCREIRLDQGAALEWQECCSNPSSWTEEVGWFLCRVPTSIPVS